MRAAAQSAQIDDHSDQQPEEIDSGRRHAAIDFPSIYQRGEGQEKETQYGQHQATGERALQVSGVDPHQNERDPGKQQNDEQE